MSTLIAARGTLPDLPHFAGEHCEPARRDEKERAYLNPIHIAFLSKDCLTWNSGYFKKNKLGQKMTHWGRKKERIVTRLLYFSQYPHLEFNDIIIFQLKKCFQSKYSWLSSSYVNGSCGFGFATDALFRIGSMWDTLSYHEDWTFPWYTFTTPSLVLVTGNVGVKSQWNMNPSGSLMHQEPNHYWLQWLTHTFSEIRCFLV